MINFADNAMFMGTKSPDPVNQKLFKNDYLILVDKIIKDCSSVNRVPNHSQYGHFHIWIVYHR